MTHRNLLLKRLDDIGRALADSGALALIGLGSVGRELERLDDYSDLDFFAIVEPGRKPEYLDDLGWLSAAAPLAYAFRNTEDGYKFLYADGIYGEMAVFEPEELLAASYTPGRLVWRREGVPDSWAAPPDWPPRRSPRDADWLLGEALTNLYVGLGRYRRGERLSAMRFIQQYAVDKVLELAAMRQTEEAGATADPFDGARRAERRFPALAAELPAFMQGYERTPESAAAILAHLETHYSLDAAIRSAIRALL